jgi:ribosome recycling factor
VQAGLGLNPSNDGKLIRVPVPALSSERRAELVRQVKALGEEFKVRLRHIRREYNDTFKTGEKDGEVTEDGLRRLLSVVQDATNDNITKIDGAVAKKETELLEV